MMLWGLKLQARSWFKLKRFEVTRNAKRRKHGVRVDVAPLRNGMAPLLHIGEQADDHNILPLAHEIAAPGQRIEAPLGPANASFDAISKPGGAIAPRKLRPIAYDGAQDIKAGNVRQPLFTPPRAHIDQLEHVSALSFHSSRSMPKAARFIGSCEMQNAVCDSDLVTAASSRAVADSQRAYPHGGEDHVGAEVASRAGVRVCETLHAGKTGPSQTGSGPGRASCAKSQQSRAHQLPHGFCPLSAPTTTSTGTLTPAAIDARQALHIQKVCDAAHHHSHCLGVAA